MKQGEKDPKENSVYFSVSVRLRWMRGALKAIAMALVALAGAAGVFWDKLHKSIVQFFNLSPAFLVALALLSTIATLPLLSPDNRTVFSGHYESTRGGIAL